MTRTMNPEVKQLWLTALRSGDYEQGTGTLHYHERDAEKPMFCCLGVLCDIAYQRCVLTRVVQQPPLAGDTRVQFLYGTEYDDVVLPQEILEWSGLREINPVIQGFELASWNDGENTIETKSEIRPHSFAEIADLIERFL